MLQLAEMIIRQQGILRAETPHIRHDTTSLHQADLSNVISVIRLSIACWFLMGRPRGRREVNAMAKNLSYPLHTREVPNPVLHFDGL